MVIRILVVDDNKLTGKFLKSLLKEKGYEVSVIQDGAETTREAKRFMPQLILMDIVLADSDMDGSGVVKELQRDEKLSNIPVIFLSAIIEGSNMLEKIKVNDKSYPALSKTATTGELLETIKRYLPSK